MILVITVDINGYLSHEYAKDMLHADDLATSSYAQSCIVVFLNSDKQIVIKILK